MKLEIEAGLAQQINKDAEELLGTLQTAPEKPSDVSGAFRPNHLQSTASLADPEIPSGPLQFTIGISGAEVERFLPDINPPVGFFGEGHARFVNLCQRIQQASPLNSYVSLTYAVEATFEWMRLRIQKKTDKPLTDHLLPWCMRDAAPREILLPLAGIDVEQEINMGKVVIKKLLQPTWERWITEWSVRRKRTEN